MNSEDTIKLAVQYAEEYKEPPATRQTATSPEKESSNLDSGEESILTTPPFLHDLEISEAIRIVNLIASGRNAFSNEPFEKLRSEHHETALRAVCAVISALAQTTRPGLALSSNAIETPAQGSLAKRPLEEYLQRLEREAIIEALEETKYNRTAAAKLLGITFRALRYRMERVGLE